MNIKLSQVLKYAGYGIAGIGAIRIVFAELSLILAHPICLITIGIGALVYFAGVWEAKHENKNSSVSYSTATTNTTGA